MTTKTQEIGLWLDSTSGDPKWVVSKDVDGTTTTLCVYDEDEYEDAKADAIEEAKERGWPVVETNQMGRTETIYTPDA